MKQTAVPMFIETRKVCNDKTPVLLIDFGLERLCGIIEVHATRVGLHRQYFLI